MDSKEEKKERRHSYFGRVEDHDRHSQSKFFSIWKSSKNDQLKILKKKKTGKQNLESTSDISHVGAASNKDDPLKVILGQSSEKEDEKKKKKGQGKQPKRSEIKRHSTGDLYYNKSEKKEKRMVMKKPLGTAEYTATGTDTLNSIALKFNITPNKLVELNRLFTHTIVPGQVLFVPVCEPHASVKESSSGLLASPMSSDAEYDKLPDADLARKATKAIERVMSSTSEEEEPVVVKFLKMNCRYITDGKGVVGGVMIVTPNNVMFDPHKSDPLVIENGCEEYGLICPMEEVVSVALYNDISHMKIKDALPSPGEWEDLSSEKDINPFSKFKSMNKGKRQTEVTGVQTPEDKTEVDLAAEPVQDAKKRDSTSTVQINVANVDIEGKKQSSDIMNLEPKKTDQSPIEDDFIELVEALVPQNDNQTCEQSKGTEVSTETGDSRISNSNFTQEDVNDNGIVDSVDRISITGSTHEPSVHKNITETKNIELCLNPTEEKNSTVLECVGSSEITEMANINFLQDEISNKININTEGKTGESTAATEKTQTGQGSDESPDSLSPYSSEEHSQKEAQMDSESELKIWLLKRMQGPIEDMLPSKEEKSKNPPMFLCIKVGKPMRKSFTTQAATVVQQYGRKRKQPEYWFAVPQERVDHLYTFFVQWSPEVYGKDAKEQGFVVVEKDELDMVDNFFSAPSTKSWEIITVEEAKHRKSACSYEEDDSSVEEFLPELKQKSNLLEEMHIEKLAQRLPARVQGYPWHLVYSTQLHGTSLKTLYRNLFSLDSPVLLVVKDMDNQIFGAYATNTFRLSDHYYGTGETFLFTFNPDFKVFKWSGENSYFINGDIASLELGGGGGRFGLWLDADLYHGRSNPCSTFNNDTLSMKEDFIVQDIEVWNFE